MLFCLCYSESLLFFHSKNSSLSPFRSSTTKRSAPKPESCMSDTLSQPVALIFSRIALSELWTTIIHEHCVIGCPPAVFKVQSAFTFECIGNISEIRSNLAINAEYILAWNYAKVKLFGNIIFFSRKIYCRRFAIRISFHLILNQPRQLHNFPMRFFLNVSLS